MAETSKELPPFKTDDLVDAMSFLKEHQLLGPDPSKAEVKSGIRWIKRNLHCITLVPARRGVYLISKSQAEAALRLYKKNTQGTSFNKNRGAALLNAKNKALAYAKFTYDNLSLNSPQLRKDWFITPEGANVVAYFFAMAIYLKPHLAESSEPIRNPEMPADQRADLMLFQEMVEAKQKKDGSERSFEQAASARSRAREEAKNREKAAPRSAAAPRKRSSKKAAQAVVEVAAEPVKDPLPEESKEVGDPSQGGNP